MTLRKQNGFTLIELIVSVSIVSILSLVIIGFLTDSSADSVRKIARSDLLYNAQVALDIANKDIKYGSRAAANNIWADAHSPGAPADRYSWQSDSDTLVIESPATNASNDFIYADQALYLPYQNDIVYFVQSGNLYRRVIAANVAGNAAITTCPAADSTPSCPEDQKLAEDVSDFNVEYLDANNVSAAPSDAHSLRLNLALSKVSDAQTIETSYTIQVVFRNG